MEPEYDLSKMKKRPNPFAKQLKKQIAISLEIDVIEYFETMAQEKGISSQELINLYLQDCVVSKRKLSLKKRAFS
ncbi:antitoxin [Oscillatoriales cyanobacterium USR001]|nr:antitoxin [Oscillatoriales cyanobacterium USR001]